MFQMFLFHWGLSLWVETCVCAFKDVFLEATACAPALFKGSECSKRCMWAYLTWESKDRETQVKTAPKRQSSFLSFWMSLGFEVTPFNCWIPYDGTSVGLRWAKGGGKAKCLHLNVKAGMSKSALALSFCLVDNYGEDIVHLHNSCKYEKSDP